MEEKKLHYKMYKDGKKFVFAGIASLSFFVFGGVSTVEVHADTTSGNLTAATVNSTSDTNSAVSSAATEASSASDTKSAAQSAATEASSASDTKSAAQSAATEASSASDTKSAAQSAATDSTSASSSSAVKAETTSASSISATNAETTGASSISATNAETTGASSISATNAETTGASSSSATNADSTSANNSSAVKAETTGASSISATKADSTSASSSSAVKTETTSASSSSATKADSANATSTNEYSASASNLSKTGAASTANSTAVKTNAKYANSVETVDNNKRGNKENTHSIKQRRRVKRSAIVTNTGFSVSDPDYPSGMWIDPDNSHYSYEWLQAKYGGNQIVFSTNRTGDGIVYVTELSALNKVLKQYTLNQNTQVTSAVFDRTIYYNDVYFEMVQSSSNSFVTKYTASKFDNTYYNTLSYFVPKLITQTTYYVDKDGKQITDSNGNPVAAYTQKGLVGQNYTTSDVNVINGYYATAPANSNGVMSPYGEIGASYVKNFHDGVVITYTQTGSDGTMSASIAQNGRVRKTWTSIEPSDPTIMYKLGYTTYGIKNPYIPQTSDIKYVYNKLGNWIVSNPDGSTTSRIYPNDPSNPTKIADSSVPDYPVIAFIPGYIPEDHMGTPLVPVDPDDRTKGYIPPTPSDNGTDTIITYTADKQKGSVSYVDDTTGKTLKTDSISGTTGSKSSYSTSGNIADYKK
ncbi:KxYKxGKxW signal peptide domain-containing protein, partial [Leuconostoc carnosum]|uniref:KxYKxGKxW signal peptide domain-containing protein n=1 Tax=Leuconostoc carnosum TaxID=1252 RepID=UPI001281FA39